jgi:hypothetical protein
VLSELKPSIIFKERKIKLKSIVEKIKENPFLAMVLCCALPLIAIFAFSSLGILGVLGKWGTYALILLCPLAHVWMMRGMFRSPEENPVQQKV